MYQLQCIRYISYWSGCTDARSEFCKILACLTPTRELPSIARVSSGTAKYLAHLALTRVLSRTAKYWPIRLPPGPKDDLLRSCHWALASLSHCFQSFHFSISSFKQVHSLWFICHWWNAIFEMVIMVDCLINARGATSTLEQGVWGNRTKRTFICICICIYICICSFSTGAACMGKSHKTDFPLHLYLYLWLYLYLYSYLYLLLLHWSRLSGEIAQNRLCWLMITSSPAAFSQNASPFSPDDSFWAPPASAQWRAFSGIFSPMLKYSRRFTSEKWAFDAGDDQKRDAVAAHLCSELSLQSFYYTTPSHLILPCIQLFSIHS